MPERRPYKSHAQVVEEAQRAVSLRKLGASYSEIGKILGLGISDVYYRVVKTEPDLVKGKAFCDECGEWVKNYGLHRNRKHQYSQTGGAA
jgi:hypothetical protein